MDASSSPSLVVSRCAAILSFIPSSISSKSPRIVRIEEIDYEIPWAYFDGVVDNQGAFGAGMIIHKNQNTSMAAFVGLGDGTKILLNYKR